MNEAKAVLAIMFGAVALIWPRFLSGHVDRRISSGDDRYFEEQRSYRAYPFLRQPGFYRALGAMLVILGSSTFFLG